MSNDHPQRAFGPEPLDIPEIAGITPMRSVCAVGPAESALELSYLVWGDRAKPAVVLVHGGKDHARNWDWTVKELVGDYCVITPDMRGHGDSGRALGGGYSGHHFVSDFAVFMDHLEAEGFSMPMPLIGHSMGGNIILNYAAVAPEKVSRVVAIEGLGASKGMYDRFMQGTRAERLQKWIDERRKIAGRRPRLFSDPEEMVERMAGVHKNLRPDQARHLALHAARHTSDGWIWKHDPYVGFFAPVDMTSPEEYSDVYRQITCPVLLMRGQDSWADDPEKDGRITAFKNARLINYPDAGHWLHHDQFDSFIKDVRAFLVQAD